MTMDLPYVFPVKSFMFFFISIREHKESCLILNDQTFYAVFFIYFKFGYFRIAIIFVCMENKKKGRKSLPKEEKKILIPVYVKSKHEVPATKDCNKIQAKYEKLK